MSRERSPGLKLLFAVLVGAALIVPLAMVYLLVYDRQSQAEIAQSSITDGWGGAQVIAGPTLVIPYTAERVSNEEVDGKTVTRTIQSRELLYLSPDRQSIDTQVEPKIKSRGLIYKSVIYDVGLLGNASFSLPEDLERFGVDRDALILDEVELRLPISDPRGLKTDAWLKVDGTDAELRPGLGTASNGSGVHAFYDWSDTDNIEVEFKYGLRGSSSLSMVPRGQETDWNVRSEWQHPSFAGKFLPDEDAVEIDQTGFSASWSISNLALGQTLLRTSEPGLPTADQAEYYSRYPGQTGADEPALATIRLVEPVDLYQTVERSVKYGFLFIGFTFLAFLMFDIVGGARVATAEYLLTGAGLILFFVMLLAFAEFIGFAAAYAVASTAIIGLLTAYSAAVLGSWKRARVIGAVLIGLYALLYVLLNLETGALIIGSVLLFVALAAVMYATRRIDWSSVAARGDETEVAAQPASPSV